MKFQQGDVVVHEVYGVGRVLNIEELSWTQPQPSMFYVVEVGDAKIWVPVEREEECHLRRLTPKEELPAYQQVFQEAPATLEDNRYGRTAYIRESRKHVTFRVLCETIRDLTSHSQKKKLADYEVSFLDRLINQLIEEWALSAEITRRQAEIEVRRLLRGIQPPGPQLSTEA